MSKTITNQYNPDVVYHPGETLAEALDDRNMSNKEFAIRTGKPEKTISEVINGKSAITADMAVLFESVLNIPSSFWLNKQMHYDEYLAKKERKERITEAEDWARNFPYAAMAKLGWVPSTRKIKEKAMALLDYFGIAKHTAWNDVYINTQLKVNYRMSIKGSKSPHALSAWLMQGENLARRVDTTSYDRKKLTKSLPLLKSIMVAEPDTLKQDIEQLMTECGVMFMFTPTIPGAPVNGITRWINGQPLIQLSDRWKRYDIFWFTLFHEIGHILLHDKKFMSIENIDYDAKDLEKEKEADEFAIKWTFSHDEEADLLKNISVTIPEIIEYADRINTHPSLVIGRLSKKGLISHAVAHQSGLLTKLVLA